ncbi:MAG: AAA family ATPase [Alphaproteobacteria bacterium]|nr:AAA family ATPase [Alphaproteobacteria bacterium]
MGGRSATANSAYIACTTLEEERTGLVFDYSKKQGLLGQGILAPEGCPEWVYDKQQLRNAVETFEDQLAQTRFRGHTDPIKNAKSLERKEKFLETCKTGFTANFALPLEIEDSAHLLELSERIVKGCYVQNGLITEWATHFDKGNPHLHILATTRPWKEDNFSETRFVIEREKLLEIRHLAAEITNQFGQEKGYNYHVDARSYEDRGINLIPSRHLGPKAYHKHKEESRIAHENNKIHQQNLVELLDHPEEILKLVATQKVVFTQADIEREVFKRAGGDMHLYNLLKSRLEGMKVSSDLLKTANDNVNLALKEHELKADYEQTLSGFAARMLYLEDTVEVGKNLRNEAVFTTKQALELEEGVTASIEGIQASGGKEISHFIKESAVSRAERRNGFSFSEEQRAAIDDLLQPGAIRVLTGKAGTGKTTVLRPVVEAYEEAGYIPVGTAFQGKVSELLAHDLEIPSYTLDQFRTYWSRYDALQETLPTLKGQALVVAQKELERLAAYQLTNRHVVILDEGNMVGGNLWQGLLSRVQEAGAHLRVVQDNNQIKALYGADISRLVEEKVGCFELNEVHRQKEEWMREASAHLNSHDDMIKGLRAYEDHGCLTFNSSVESTRYALAAAYVNNLQAMPHELHMALAFQTKDVSDLNEAIHHQLKQIGALGESFVYGGKAFAVGDRIVFTENDHTERLIKTIDSGEHQSRQKGVKNGSFGWIRSIDAEHSQLEIELRDGRLIGVNLKTYDHIDYGYAMTTNKAESQTFDHVYGWFDRYMSANKTLIWMTRHRLTFQGFISSEQAVDVKSMADAVGRSEYRPLISDFGNSPEADLMREYLTVSYEAGNIWGMLSRESGTESTTQVLPYDQPEWVDFQAAQEERNRLAEEILKNWEGARTFAHQAGIKKATLEVQAGLKARELSTVEVEALQRVETYRSVAMHTRSLWDEISKSGNLPKTHPRVQVYEEMCQNRNQLAYEIASFPQIHSPFFKATPLDKAAEEQADRYVTYGGEVYDKRPPSFNTAEKHSQAYILAQRQAIFKEKLTSSQKWAFEELLTFKDQVLTCGRLYAALKELEGSLQGASSKAKDISTLTYSLEESTKERDFLAFKIVHSFDKYSPLLERAGMDLDSQDQLLKYAVYGEVRQIALKYTLSKTVEKRLDYADQLHKMMMGDGEGTIDKGLYGRVKSLGIDMARLRFEQGCLSVMQNGTTPLHFETVADLNAAFTSLETYRQVQKEVAQHWTIIKTQAVEKVVLLQKEQLESLNALASKQEEGKEQGLNLTREAIEEKALEVLKIKDPANTQVLSTITREITSIINAHVVNGYAASSTPLPRDIQSRQLELMDIQSHLRKGHSGYVGIYNRGPQDLEEDQDQNKGQNDNKYKAWEALREKRVSLATSTLAQYGEVIKVSFAHDFKRMEKDSYEHHVAQVIKTYEGAHGEHKAELASNLVANLDQEDKNRLVKTQLKKADVNFEALHLYALYHNSASVLEDKGKDFKLLETYVRDQTYFSALWKPRSEVIEKQLGTVKESFNLQREDFISQLESRNPSRPCSFVVDRLINETHALKTKAATEEEFPQPIEETLQIRLQEHDKSFEWNLTKEDLHAFTQELIELSHKRDQIHDQRLEIMKKTHFDNDKDFFKAAKDRNESAFHLMKSPLGQIIEDSTTHIFAVKNYAERYVEKKEREQERNQADSHSYSHSHGSYSPTMDEKVAAYDVPPLINRKEIVETALKQNMADFADHIFSSLGEEHNRAMSTRTIRRYGKSGGICVNIQEGVWYNHKDNSMKGGPIQMIMQVKNMEFNEALDYGAHWARLSPEQLRAQKRPFDPSHAQKIRQENREKETKEIQQKIERGKGYWEKGKPIQGTIAERYLKEHRKIEGRQEWPKDFRYLPNVQVAGEGKKTSYPCLMVAARSPTGELTAVQLTFLDPLTANKADVTVKKRSYGLLKGSAVTIQVDKASNLLFVAEGVETALSLKESGLKGTIKASLGISNIQQLEPKDPNTHIIICGDHDGPESMATKNLEKSAAALREKGFKVTVIKPDHRGEDFNDVLKKHGPEGVREILKQVVPQALTQPVVTKDTNHAPVKAEAEKVLHKIAKNCEKLTYAYIEKENVSFTNELKERIPIQAERAANLIFYAHTLNGTKPTEKETKLFIARAKYELDRIPEIKEKLTNEWHKKGNFDEKNDPLIIHMIAERRASIEGRLFFEAREAGEKPSSDIPKLAEIEFKTNKAHTNALAQNLGAQYSLSKNASAECARNTLRYQETHGSKPTDTQMTAMAQIAHQIEEKYPDFHEKDIGAHNLTYLRRMNGDSMFRERCYDERHSIAHEHDDMLKMQEKALLKIQEQQIRQEMSRQKERDLSMSM